MRVSMRNETQSVPCQPRPSRFVRARSTVPTTRPSTTPINKLASVQIEGIRAQLETINMQLLLLPTKISERKHFVSSLRNEYNKFANRVASVIALHIDRLTKSQRSELNLLYTKAVKSQNMSNKELVAYCKKLTAQNTPANVTVIYPATTGSTSLPSTPRSQSEASIVENSSFGSSNSSRVVSPSNTSITPQLPSLSIGARLRNLFQVIKNCFSKLGSSDNQTRRTHRTFDEENLHTAITLYCTECNTPAKLTPEIKAEAFNNLSLLINTYTNTKMQYLHTLAGLEDYLLIQSTRHSFTELETAKMQIMRETSVHLANLSHNIEPEKPVINQLECLLRPTEYEYLQDKVADANQFRDTIPDTNYLERMIFANTNDGKFDNKMTTLAKMITATNLIIMKSPDNDFYQVFAQNISKSQGVILIDARGGINGGSLGELRGKKAINMIIEFLTQNPTKTLYDFLMQSIPAKQSDLYQYFLNGYRNQFMFDEATPYLYFLFQMCVEENCTDRTSTVFG